MEIRIKYNKLDEAIGMLFGLLLYYFWFFAVFLIQSVLLSKEYIIHNTVVYKVPNNEFINWLSNGLLLFYLVLGHYITTRKELDVKLMRNLILGFTVWLLVLAILNIAGFSILSFLQHSLKLSPSTSILLSIFVGYAVILAICFILGYRSYLRNYS